MQWFTLPLIALSLMTLPHAGAWGQAPARLVVTSESGEVLIDDTVVEGGRWCMAWNHSVAHFTVLDCYRNQQGQMVLERSHQPDFAAGLGHIAGRGEQVSDGEGGYWINAIDEPVPSNRYLLRAGAPGVNHRIVWPDGEHEPSSISERAAGERVTIELASSSSANTE
ncbi:MULTISPECIES: DUF1850 domain-containing protein [unclassified Halomonas]|uniref:DUF1850 domain-containing protein n=1 Tax=unclassified Halomonas TaxID=2609666 RepID=UPI0021E3F9F6|nr:MULTISPECIES: DUF1850 domain-containing protein [unclassified Halomonas]UYF99172.1 DUF1850 domain-containing protein [Halomonas sp. GD1P12]WNL39671.1 DUF1850 domain-containing protein [Halomonas sp. PAMB 3232]